MRPPDATRAIAPSDAAAARPTVIARIELESRGMRDNCTLCRVIARSLVAATLVVLVGLGMRPLAQSPQSDARLNAALEAFLSASSSEAAERAVKQLASSGADVDALFAKLREGRAYPEQKTGRIEIPSSDGAGTLDNVVEVPAEYDPKRRWPVRVSLHGGVGRERPAAGQAPRPLTNRIPSQAEIVIHPRAWLQSAWWTHTAVVNIDRLLDQVKRRYNVDENNVYVTGISDGGTGVWFLAMRASTPWSACLPLNGHPAVIANPGTGADGQLHAGNLVNCPLYIVNGGKDPLYPASSVQRYLDVFKAGGIPFVFKVYPEAGHDVSWWPQERPRFESFVSTHHRDPNPATVSWETERTDRYNRFRWIVIDSLGGRSSDAALADADRYDAVAGLVSRMLFERPKDSGRADAVRKGNSIEARTRGVRSFTLLLSPDVIDFARPVTVTVNGRKVHDALVKKDVDTLLTWAARDNDRTMLYAAELRIEVP
jgi:dienelactone hydrolase